MRNGFTRPRFYGQTSSGILFGHSLSLDVSTETAFSPKTFGLSHHPNLNRPRPITPVSPTRSRPMSCLLDVSRFAATDPTSNCLSAFAFPDNSSFEFADFDDITAQSLPI